ncbi:choline-sulfatase [Coraliomargarita sinensis]|uniref:Choline-sulfatase n=1 Tax=Coraliomargarita sinensis TaxID=2174842 RepID=A0A317ZIU9_9BACT|nr:sulfatase [Coraliomargarita sinensis]PXA04892.1 choline-sulfatase [Coraliomargarita sinensis]
MHRIRHVLLALLFGQTALLAAPAKNVILIGIDDLNDWVGCLDGHPQVQTPNIDRLAAEGTLFSNAHCQAPVCNPSRTSLVTGLRPTTTGVYGLSPWFRSVDELKDLTSLPQAFRKNGYRTALTGKIFHTYPPNRKDRAAEFEQYGPPCNFGPIPEKKFVKELPHKLVDWGVFPEKDEQQNDYEIASWAVDFIQQAESDEKPFFLGVGFGRPHVPLFASREWFDLYPEETLKMPPVLFNDRDDVPEFAWYLNWRLPEPRLKWVQENHQWLPLVRAYLASVSFVDSQVGRVLDALENSPHADNTIVVLFSDHGWHLGEKGITGKNTLWERSTRVPLIIAGPDLPKSQDVEQPAELLDIYPTLLELCGIEAVSSLEGLSLKPQLDRPDTPRRPAITTHNIGNHSVRSKDWRYIRYADGSEELYNLKEDPNEWHNLAAQAGQQARIAELRQYLPKDEAKHVKGSGGRVLWKEDGIWYWERKDIRTIEKSF